MTTVRTTTRRVTHDYEAAVAGWLQDLRRIDAEAHGAASAVTADAVSRRRLNCVAGA